MMNGNLTLNNSIFITEFKTISVFENGLIFRNKNLEVKNVLFSEVSKIYIQKCKYSLINKIIFFTSSLVLVSFTAKYLPKELVLFASMIIFCFLIVKMNTYKWYRLVVHLHDGTIHSKEFYSSKKQEYINHVSMVRKVCFDYVIKSNFEVDRPPKVII